MSKINTLAGRCFVTRNRIAKTDVIGETRVMNRLAALLSFVVAAPAFAAGSNFAECIIDRMPGAQNDAVAGAIFRTCLAEHPGGLDAVSQGSGRGWFSYESGNECIIKKGEKIISRNGGNMLTGACNKLYDPAAPWLKYRDN